MTVCIRWPKYWSFSSTISPSNDYFELTSFKIDWFDHLAVQETLKSLLQHHSSRHQFFDWLILYPRASKYATIKVEFLFSSLTFCILYFETFSYVKSESVNCLFCPTLCDPMGCSTSVLPVPHHLPEFAQVHVHCISDAIQPSQTLTASFSVLNLSQHQGFFPV